MTWLKHLIRIYEKQIILASRKSHKLRIYQDFIKELKELDEALSNKEVK